MLGTGRRGLAIETADSIAFHPPPSGPPTAGRCVRCPYDPERSRRARPGAVDSSQRRPTNEGYFAGGAPEESYPTGRLWVLIRDYSVQEHRPPAPCAEVRILPRAPLFSALCGSGRGMRNGFRSDVHTRERRPVLSDRPASALPGTPGDNRAVATWPSSLTGRS